MEGFHSGEPRRDVAHAVAVARAFVREHYPDSPVSFLGGSAAAGRATRSSDLDIFVLVHPPTGETSYAETIRFQGWLVEAFVHSPTAADRWIRQERAERRPVLDSVIAEGHPLSENDETDRWAQASRAALAAGPPTATPAEVDLRRYHLSALIDDLEDSSDAAQTYIVGATAFRDAAELILLIQRRWLSGGKSLIPKLQETNDFGLSAWAAGDPQDKQTLIDICRQILSAAGGYLQEGFVRGTRP